MADAKKCDRCGKLFEPYIKAEDMRPKKESDNPGYLSISSRRMIFKSQYYIDKGNFDLCQECAKSFSRWLEKPRIVKHECSNFGNIDKQNLACKTCPRYQECEEAAKEKKHTKQKECNVFGAFDGSVDCLMCPKCDECKEATKAIKEANAGGK